MTSGKLVMHCK